MACSIEQEEYTFFDAQGSSPSVVLEPQKTQICTYDVWVRTPKSVKQRKNRFLRSIDLGLDGEILGENLVDEEVLINRVTETSAAVLRSPIREEIYSTTSSLSSWCDDASDLSRELVSRETFVCRAESLEMHTECKEQEGGTSSPQLVQKIVERHIKVAGTMARTMNRVKGRFLNRLRSMACVADGPGRCNSLHPGSGGLDHWAKVRRVKVRQNKKRSKELSAVFIGQDIQAHQGSILTMKFSLDGRFLASAGEDGVVRIWQVVQEERSNDTHIPDMDPSCLYFTMNRSSELTPLMAEKQKVGMLKSLRKSADSACVIFPPKVFRLVEKPVHEFRGHSDEVLDLSWSKDNLLLSSSIDETVRLWRVGSDECLKVFPHNNYVTCVQFGPLDENYFVSGSIDGKVRIWSLSSSQVVDWIDVREIVTAVTYSPDGKGGIIGSMTGCCRFFSLSDNHFQLEASVSLNSKKKSPCKRIISFQFCPKDPSQVMVTCADSHVRILQGINVIGKYKGQRNAGNPFSASYTSDGKHIVSACEDSNVYIWNRETKKEGTVRSFESFSTDASVALPWPGPKSSTNPEIVSKLDESLPFSSPCYLSSLSQKESIPKGSATWPEEKLPFSSSNDAWPEEKLPFSSSNGTWPEEKLPFSSGSISSSLCKSQYKFFKSSCQSSSNCHMWGLVVVAAGWDGRIRSFINYGLPVPV